jgi:hypothetical protein
MFMGCCGPHIAKELTQEEQKHKDHRFHPLASLHFIGEGRWAKYIAQKMYSGEGQSQLREEQSSLAIFKDVQKRDDPSKCKPHELLVRIAKRSLL